MLICFATTAFAVPADAATYVNRFNAQGTQLDITIGNELARNVKIGGEVLSLEPFYYCDHYENCHNVYYYHCNQYLATNTNSSGPELPYNKIVSASPAAKAVLANTAAALGYQPGDAFGIEIGKFNGEVYTPCDRLNVPMHYAIYARMRPGCLPAMLALLPNGTVTLLSPYEFDQSCAGQWYLDGSHMFYLHTIYPDAVYMMVHIPQ